MDGDKIYMCIVSVKLLLMVPRSAISLDCSDKNDINVVDCKSTLKGRDYNGTLNRTRYGTFCQVWTSQSPHSHTVGVELGDHNYCRVPNEFDNPWCYTIDPDDRYEFCDTPLCAECVVFENKKYFISSDMANFDDAKFKCNNRSGRLAELDSETKTTFFWRKMTQKENSGDYWLGGSDIEKEGNWIWITSRRAINHTSGDWYPGQPNNVGSGGEHCLLMLYQYNYKWVDGPCNLNSRYICEGNSVICVNKS